jgi:phosphatidylserine/phosphatidylglycerophosphate/cardiolipin synthase-like enzyme
MLALLVSTTGALAEGPNATSYSLIVEPAQGLTAIYGLVNSARHSIDVTIYELDDTVFEQYLAKQAAAGVTVRVILDKNLEESSNQAAYTYLNANGVSAHWANPKYAATHQKTITIDAGYISAQTAILTLNLTPRYYLDTRDFAILSDDANDIADIETTFEGDFNSTPITPPVGDNLVWSPTNAQSALENLMNSAQHTLLVENEEMSDKAIVDALVSAAQRGVNVQIIMNAGTTYTSEWNRIVAVGGDVSTYSSSAPLYIHAKVILADYGYPAGSVFLGSENFSVDSLTKNRELGLIIDDLPTMQSLAAVMTSDFLGGKPYAGSRANFALALTPGALATVAGSAVSATIASAGFNAFTGSIALSAAGLPSGVAASFGPAGIEGAGSARLTLTATDDAAIGTSLVTITGVSDGLTATATILLTVTPAERQPTQRRRPRPVPKREPGVGLTSAP